MGFSLQWVGPFLRCLMVGSFVLMPSLSSAQDAGGISAETLKGRPYSPYADRAFPTDVFFGDTHVHTALSADAGGGGTKLLPRDAYRFARGEQVMSNTGQPVKLRQPLDFYMITDHSDGMGAIVDILKGAPNVMADEQGKAFHEDFNAGGEQAQQAAFRLSALFTAGKISPTLNYQPGNPAYKRVWADLIKVAEESDAGEKLWENSTAQRNYWTFCATSACWTFSVQIAAPFFSVYLVQVLGATAGIVGTLAAVQNLAALPGQVLYGRLLDRRGIKRTFAFSGLLIPLMIWSWVLVRSPWGVLPIRVAAGFLFAGYNLSNFNMLLSVTPQVHRTRHIALYRTITQVSVAVAPLLGGLIVDRFGFLPVFALSGTGRLTSMLLLMRFVREPRKRT